MQSGFSGVLASFEAKLYLKCLNSYPCQPVKGDGTDFCCLESRYWLKQIGCGVLAWKQRTLLDRIVIYAKYVHGGRWLQWRLAHRSGLTHCCANLKGCAPIMWDTRATRTSTTRSYCRLWRTARTMSVIRSMTATSRAIRTRWSGRLSTSSRT